MDLAPNRCRVRNLSRTKSIWVTKPSRSGVKIDRLPKGLAVPFWARMWHPLVSAATSQRVTGFGWLPGAPFLEHGEQGQSDHSVEGCFAGVILSCCGEQGVE